MNCDSVLDALALAHFSDCVGHGHVALGDNVGEDDFSDLLDGESDIYGFDMVSCSFIDSGCSSHLSLQCSASDCVSSALALLKSVSLDSCSDCFVGRVIDIEEIVDVSFGSVFDAGVAGHVCCSRYKYINALEQLPRLRRSVGHAVEPKIADEGAKSEVGCFDFIDSHDFVVLIPLALPDCDFLIASDAAAGVCACEVNSAMACSPICESVWCAVVGVSGHVCCSAYYYINMSEYQYSIGISANPRHNERIDAPR